MTVLDDQTMGLKSGMIDLRGSNAWHRG